MAYLVAYLGAAEEWERWEKNDNDNYGARTKMRLELKLDSNLDLEWWKWGDNFRTDTWI